jgi:hypothetical protein
MKKLTAQKRFKGKSGNREGEQPGAAISGGSSTSTGLLKRRK